LRTALLLIFMALVILPFAANLSINFQKVLNIIEVAARKEAISTLRESYFALNKKIVQRQESVRLLCGVTGIKDLLSGQRSSFPMNVLSSRLSGLLKEWFDDQNDVREVMVFDLAGNVKFKMVRSAQNGLERAGEAWLGQEEAIVREYRLGDVAGGNNFIIIVENVVKFQDDYHSHEPCAKIAAVVTDFKGQVVGFASVLVDIASLLKRAHFDFLATGSGLFIKWSIPHTGYHQHNPGDLFKVFPELKKVFETGRAAVLADANGTETAWFPILADARPGQDLWAGQAVDETLVVNLKNMIVTRIAVVTGIAVGIILLLAVWLSARIDRHRSELKNALESLLLGKGMVKLRWKGPAEIQSLAKDLNELFEKFIQNDIKRREAMDRLSELSSRMRMILDNAAEGIIEINSRNEITFVNRAACRILGFSREELQGNDLHSIIHYMKEDRSQYPEEDCPFCKAIQEGKYDISKEEVFWKRDGTPVSVEYVTAPVRDQEGKVTGLVMCLRDISSRKAAEDKARAFEDQLRQAQKMEAVGTLAGGVAHDFNNLLTAIRGYTELLELDLKDDPRALQQLGSIRESADRAAALVRQLLAFSRKQVAEKKITDVNALLVEQQKMLRLLIGEDMELDIKTAPGKATVFADPNMLAQVIMNMVVNARDAMLDSPAKKITISVEKTVLSSEETAGKPDMRPGSYVVISISDTGAGIEDSLLEKIFDPFFTTKGMDKGTGLGLAVAYGIIEQHNGWITCLSTPGAGTTFRIFLPGQDTARDSCRIEKGGPATGKREIMEQVGHGITAFILEDDPLVQGITRDMLKALGFNVVSASSVQEASYLMDRIGQDIGLVVSDVVLPDGNGIDFIESVLKSRKDLPVLLLSGYMDEKVHMERIRNGEIPFLAKPFRIGDLQEAVARLVGS